MNNQSTDIDLIERYLDGSLSDKEMDAFDDRTKTDPIFLMLFLKRKLLQASYVEATKQNKLKKRIRLIVTDHKRKSANQRKIFLIAASFISLIGIGSFFLIQSRQTTNTNLAKQEIGFGEDEVVVGQKNNIAEYGSVDSVNKKSANSSVTFLPPEGAVFQQTDTIWFFPQNADANIRITVLDKSGSVVKKVSINSGRPDYKILPHVLKPGTYSWYFSTNETTKHTFKIQ